MINAKTAPAFLLGAAFDLCLIWLRGPDLN